MYQQLQSMVIITIGIIIGFVILIIIIGVVTIHFGTRDKGLPNIVYGNDTANIVEIMKDANDMSSILGESELKI